MTSTYVNDLRLNEMATGDQSGSWGTVTNTNLELIAEAFSYGTEAITTNADTHTTTIADGGTDPGRSMFLKYTGTLDSACTITIGPNTVSKLWFIENATSGSQNIIIKQGSGATVTIASGKTKVIYSDGVGSGAKMVDAFAALDVGSLSTTGDITFGDNDKAIFGAGSDLQIYHTTTGNHSIITESGSGNLIVAADNFEVNNAANNANKITATTGGAVTLYHNNALKISTTATGIDVTGDVVNSAHLLHNNTSGLKIISGGNATNDGSNLTLYGSTNASAGTFRFRNGTATHLSITGGGDISFYEDTGTTAKFFWDSAAESLGIGTSSPSEALDVVGSARVLRNTGATNTSDQNSIIVGATTTGVYNASYGAGIQFQITNSAGGYSGSRIVSRLNADNNTANLVFQARNYGFSDSMTLDSSGKVGIGTSSPAALLDVQRTTIGTIANFRGSDAARNLTIASSTTTALGDTYTLDATSSTGVIAFATATAERMRIDSSGNLLVGKTSDNAAIAGSILNNNGDTYLTAEGSRGRVLYLNRLTSDGEIVDFRKDGTTVGSIGTTTGLYIASPTCGIRLHSGGTKVFPTNGSGVATDGTVDLGALGGAWKDLYLSGTAYLTNSSSITGTTASASSLNLASGHTGSAIGLYIGEFGVSANLGIGIDANRIVTMPAQPAFSAIPTSTQSNIAANTSVTIVLGTEVFDQNNDFSGSQFTAPVTGKYQLNFFIRLENLDHNASYYQLSIITSNRAYRYTFDPDFGQDNTIWSAAWSALADMDAGDTAYLSINQGGGIAQTDIHVETCFSGHLVA